MTKTRSESDSFGNIDVASDRYWGAQTQRSLQNFKIGGETMPKPLIHALGTLKRSAAVVNMQLGEVIFGGVGSGLYGMLVFIFVTIFIAGLMIGRTPEYLGKKIEAHDVKLASLAVLVTAFGVLIPTAWSCVSSWGLAGLNNSGPHGLAEILYYYSSCTGNNGSAFAGLTTNTPWYNSVGAVVILFGRFFIIIPVMALAGSLVAKKSVPVGPGSFPVGGATFVILLVSTILIIGALTFFPVLAMTQIVEHFLMIHTTTTF